MNDFGHPPIETPAEQFPDAWREAILKWVQSTPLVTAVYLFGSRAKGCARVDSDIDLAFQCSADEAGNSLSVAIFNTEKWQQQLNDVLPKTVDLQHTIPEEDEIVWPAVQDHGLRIV